MCKSRNKQSYICKIYRNLGKFINKYRENRYNNIEYDRISNIIEYIWNMVKYT